MKRSTLSRRHFLRTAAGSALALPLLRQLPGQTAAAQMQEAPRRVIFFYTPCGPNPNLWWPTGGEYDFVLNQSMQPLQPFRDRLLILDGIEMKSATADPAPNGHDRGSGNALAPYILEQGAAGPGDFGHLSEGSAGGVSIDQHIASALAGETPFRSLEFGVKSNRPTSNAPFQEFISWRGPYQGQPAMQSPGAAFDRVFGPILAGQPLRDRRRSVLDGVQRGLNRLRSGLGREDQLRVDVHVESVRELEGRLTSLGGMCALPDREDPRGYGEVGRAHIDILVQALTCDLTRVASVQWSTAQSPHIFQNLGHLKRHHALSHEADPIAEAKVAQIDHWYAQQFAYLLARLDAVSDSSGRTLLDQTAVVWVGEQAAGTNNSHGYSRMPYVIAGGCGGAFNTGRYLDFGDRSHSDLFVSIMNAMGVEGDRFGDPRFCTGALPGLG